MINNKKIIKQKMNELINEFVKGLVLLFQKKKSNSVKEEGVVEQKLSDESREVVETENTEKKVVTEIIFQFIKGEAHLADNPTVEKIRELIKDEFSLGKSGDCLNCTEYVQFRVKQKTGIDIKWPLDRPRNGGKWATIFERNNLYRVFDSPVVDCAVSFTDNISNNSETNKIGHVAFVEKVNDDDSIEISEANWPNQGKYNERRLEKSHWKDKYRCRFISFK